MKPVNRIFPWLWIFSILFMGCYSSVTVDPTGTDRGRIWSGQIDYVIMKDDTKYKFDVPPTIVKEAIVGQVKYREINGIGTKQVSLSLSDVKHVHVSEFQPMNTTFLVLGVIAVGALITIILSAD